MEAAKLLVLCNLSFNYLWLELLHCGVQALIMDQKKCQSPLPVRTGLSPHDYQKAPFKHDVNHELKKLARCYRDLTDKEKESPQSPVCWQPHSHRCHYHVLMLPTLLSPTDGAEQLGTASSEHGEVEKPSGVIRASSRRSHPLMALSDWDQRWVQHRVQAGLALAAGASAGQDRVFSLLKSSTMTDEVNLLKPRSHCHRSHTLMAPALLAPANGVQRLGPVPAAGVSGVAAPIALQEQGEVEKP
ncbi:hypothetical protein QTO34_000862 [Cnephaeus nilssonii]|uniref:Uncharacterized protein n=1 Tax=Cnephaeus nilssonii TaxID=3371016 RepID=A0AA40IC87_CNENI|nr:hypothetical protein QTO34_000862 [Eptesicus nilssonii]